MVLDFGLLNSGLFPTSDASGAGMSGDTNTVIWNDVGIGIVPIGAVVAWCKSLTGVPSLLPSFVECNGQVLSDGDSPLNGQTIPNLNASGGGVKRFLRGSATSGTTADNETHTHQPGGLTNSITLTGAGTATAWVASASASSLPSYYEVVWIMRVK